MHYTTIKHNVECELVISRSRFITNLMAVDNEDDALNKLKKIKKHYSDATHNVYAYISNYDGTGIRFSDDGEPQGTSAMPMLEVLKKKGVVKILAVVTRYFGGIKLGANGLSAAYTRAVAEAILHSELIKYSLSNVIKIEYSYTHTSAIEQILKNNKVLLLDIEYSDIVKAKIATPTDNVTVLINAIEDITHGNAIIELEDDTVFNSYE